MIIEQLIVRIKWMIEDESKFKDDFYRGRVSALKAVLSLFEE